MTWLEYVTNQRLLIPGGYGIYQQLSADSRYVVRSRDLFLLAVGELFVPVLDDVNRPLFWLILIADRLDEHESLSVSRDVIRRQRSRWVQVTTLEQSSDLPDLNLSPALP